jgi:hypothetical protein
MMDRRDFIAKAGGAAVASFLFGVRRGNDNDYPLDSCLAKVHYGFEVILCPR